MGEPQTHTKNRFAVSEIIQSVRGILYKFLSKKRGDSEMSELLSDVNYSLRCLDEFCSENEIFSNLWTTKGVRKVLLLLKREIEEGREIDKRLLRATKDMYVVTFRNFDGTEFHDSINALYDRLRQIYPKYHKLEPLGMDFGKGNPI